MLRYSVSKRPDPAYCCLKYTVDSVSQYVKRTLGVCCILKGFTIHATSNAWAKAYGVTEGDFFSKKVTSEREELMAKCKKRLQFDKKFTTFNREGCMLNFRIAFSPIGDEADGLYLVQCPLIARTSPVKTENAKTSEGVKRKKADEAKEGEHE